MKTQLLAIAIASSLVGAPAYAEDEAAGPWSGNLTAVSDYVFRGVSQTDEDPTLQAGFKFSHESGFYAGMWASGVDYGNDIDADLEVDGFVGYAWSLSEDWGADVQVVRYFYPGTNDDYDLDYNELIAALSYQENVTFTLAWSNDVFNSDESGLYLGVAGGIPLPNEFSLDLGAGYYMFDDDLFVDDDSYTHFSVGVSRTFGRFDTSLTYHDTDSSAESLFGETLADQRLVLSAGISF